MRQPTPAPESLDAALYRGDAQYAIERRTIFARSWLLAAHESQLPETGSYVATSIAGFPIIVVKGEGGKIRAFHNVCRHRAGPLAHDGEGRCEGQLVCRYHGWRYALDGRLANARDFGPAEGFDPRQFSLFPIACESWRGFVFVNMNEKPARLADAVAPLAAKTHDVPLESFRFWRRQTHEIRCNWKTYVENYLEGYHIPLVHPGLNEQVEAAKYTVDVEPPAVFHWAPPRSGAPMSGLWAWLWPCHGVNVYRDGLMMERMWPVGPDSTVLDYLYCFPDEMSEPDRERPLLSSTAITAEDLQITEAVQRNLDAGIYRTGRLSPRHETGVAWFQAEVLAATRQP
ncbi:MAG TPA: aromatic ring-hydroxylating dioxygenase subunit alpha [Rhizomicrobium sp.]|nr:aromatic ring-hydroxylating dioxygenase subunit alpha [Rhizomicrobium sp.]